MGQTTRPPFLAPAPLPPSPVLAQPNPNLKPIRPNLPKPDEIRIDAVTTDHAGEKTILRGNAVVETSEMILRADYIDYDRETGEAHARGHVQFEHYTQGEKMEASRVDYNVEEQTGTFFDVKGTTPAKIRSRPGVLTSSNPFYFEAKWAEREQDKYILHDGMITDCKVPNPWWVLRGPKFDVIPGDRALAYNSIFWLRRIPLFYAPAFKRSLRRNPRQSGFLTPNIGNSSRRGQMVAGGYYWAINRSYDATYVGQYFTQRGFAHHGDVRGKVNDRTDFDLTVYGVNDRGIVVGEILNDQGVKIADQIHKQGGFLAAFHARSDFGDGWQARADINYLSSFEFRQNFTESFHEAINAESRSIAAVSKHWSSFGANLAFDRDEVFQITSNVEDRLMVRKLPEFDFLSRERQISNKILPIWVSLDSSASLLHRSQPLFETRDFVDRMDIAPRVMTAVYWKGFSLVPSYSIRETHYGSSLENGAATGQNIFRHSREFTVDLTIPSLSRIFDSPKWLGGGKLKHVIEPHASYRDIGGIDNFSRIIRFDETDIYANTKELELSIINRLYTKTKDGRVAEVLTWQLTQRRYFDPTFGGALVPGQRNVFIASSDLTGYAFLNQPRNYSPVVSSLRYVHKFILEWRADYDPLRGGIVNSGFNAGFRKDKYFVYAGHSQVHNDPVLAPSSNQFNGTVGIGNENRRGWNAGSSIFYDYRQQTLTYASTQVNYNTDCCGFSVQYRRFGIATRSENDFRVAFSVANIGSFGTLKRQEKMF